MFETSCPPPGGWEFGPDCVELDVDNLDDIFGDQSLGGDDFVWQAVGHDLGADTLTAVTAVDFDHLSTQGQLMALRRLEQLGTHVDSLKADLTMRIAGPAITQPRGDDKEFAAEEISVALNVSAWTADARIRFSRDLHTRLTATKQAMSEGRITLQQARHLSEQTLQLPLDVAHEVEEKVLKYSWRQDLTKFKNSTRSWIAKKDPDFTAKAKEARAEPIVSHEAGPDGTGVLYIRGPLEITTQISMALTALAAKTKAELGGSAAARKLAGLRDMVENWDGDGADETAGASRSLRIALGTRRLLRSTSYCAKPARVVALTEHQTVGSSASMGIGRAGGVCRTRCVARVSAPAVGATNARRS